MDRTFSEQSASDKYLLSPFSQNCFDKLKFNILSINPAQ